MDETRSNAGCFDAGLTVGHMVSSSGEGESVLAVRQDTVAMSESLKSGGATPVELAAASAAGLVPRAAACESPAPSDTVSVLPGQDGTSLSSIVVDGPLSSVQGQAQTALTLMSSVPSDTVPVPSVSMDTVSVTSVPSDTVSVSSVPSDTVSVPSVPCDTVPVSSVPSDTVSVSSVLIDTVSVSSVPSDTVPVLTVPSDTVLMSPLQGGNIPVSLMQSSTAPVLQLQNNAFPVSLVQSDTALLSQVQSDNVLVSPVQSSTDLVSSLQDDTALSPMQNDTVSVSLQNDSTPLSLIQNGTAPVTLHSGTAPVSVIHSGTAPASQVQNFTAPMLLVQSGTVPVSSVQSGGVSPTCSASSSSLMDVTTVSLARDNMTCHPAAVVTVSSCALDMETDPSQCVSAELTPAAYVQCMDTSGESEPVLTPLSVSNNSANGSFLNQADDDTMETEPSVGCTAHLDEDSADDGGFLKPNAVGSPAGEASGDATEFRPYTPPQPSSQGGGHLQQILSDVGISERSPSPEPELHCLVCNVHLDDDELTVPLDAVLESFTERVSDKLGTVINNDYKLYLHSDVVCDNCHKVLTEIHHQELETKKLKDLVVADFWDTVELRGIRPQRRGRRRGRPSKVQLEAERQRQFIPEMDQFRDPPDVYHLPPKKTAKSAKSKCYVKLGTNSYQCVRCLKLFPRMRSARKHYELLHGKKEEHCLQCNKFFRHRSLLVKHRQRVHGVVMSDEEEEETAAAPEQGPATGSSSDPAAGPSEAADAEHPAPPDDSSAWQGHIDPADPDSAVKFEPGVSAGAEDATPEDQDAVATPDPDPTTDGRQLRQHLHRAPVIQDDDDEEAEMMMVDMDVIMNVNGEPIQRRRRSVGRPRRRQSLVSPDDRHMYTEVPPAPESNGVAPRFQCLLCTNSYSRQSKARDHFMAKHAQLPRFSCNVCAQMFLTYKQKRHHELSHTAEACGKCGKKYPGNRRGMLERHVIQCGQLKKCKDCEAEFDSVAECLKHRREVHDKTAACEVCGKVVSARNLGSHRAIHSDERNYTCHLCGASFKAKGSLDTHLRTHSEERPFTCTTCGRSFKHRNNWKDHERSHLNIRDYVCHFCSKTFKQSKNLKQHLRQHDANPEIFSCPHCPSTFKYKYNMLAHVKTLHTGELGRRVRRRGVRPSSELSMPGPSAGQSAAAVVGAAVSMAALHHHQQQQQHGGLMTAPDPLQMSPTSCDSNTSGLPAAVGGSASAAAAMSQQNRALQQMGAISPNVVFMPSLQHHSIFS